MSNLFRTP
nr:unnamed protein product [Callosobruchus analis]